MVNDVHLPCIASDWVQFESVELDVGGKKKIHIQ